MSLLKSTLNYKHLSISNVFLLVHLHITSISLHHLFFSLSLVRYFQCAPNRGLFTRLHRLSRYPLDENGNRLLDVDDPNTLTTRIRRIRSPTEGRVTTTFTRVTSATPAASIPHYALPARPAKVITTVTTTTTTTMQKPKSALKNNTCRGATSNIARHQNHVHF